MLCGQLINWSYLLLSRPTLGGVNIVSRLYKYYIARTVLYNAYIYNRSRVQRVMVLYNAAIVRRPAPPVHQNIRPYQRWSGVGGDQAPALLGNLGVQLQFHIIQQIMGASLLEDLFHVFENDDEDIFVPAGLRAPHDWVLCLSGPSPSSSCCTCKPSFCITLFVCFYPHLHLQNHPFTKYSVFHILAVFIRALPSRPPPLRNHPFTKHTVFHIFFCFSHF